MKGWQFNGAHQPLELVERPDPETGPGQILLKVRGAGLCHSDVGFLDGTITAMLARVPLILGHEVAGTVARIGPEVTGFAVGDRVVASGPEHYAPGWTVDGGYADKCLVMAEGLIRLPDSVSFAQGAAATDAGQTAYGGVMGAGAMLPGMRVGVIGLGGLGMAGARIAVINGAAEVYAAEPRESVWEAALALGVKQVFADASGFMGLDLDLIVDFAGFGATTAAAIAAVKPGGTVSQVGLGSAEATISTPLLVGKAVTLRGSRGGQSGDTEKVIAHMAAGELHIETTAISFEEIPEGLARLERGGVVGRLVAEMGA